MRSRTELVTTTFIDSEEDPTESDDSEEDWRPSQSAKRRPSKPMKHRRKRRKLNFPAQTTFKEAFRRQHKAGGLGKASSYFASRSSTVADQKLLLEKFTAGQNPPEKSEPFELYLYKKDLDESYKENSHLCLWRRDNMNLLQKYIRVKTTNLDEFIFTSSSVYSSWDDKRRRDFVTITVKQMEENNRRVTLLNSSDLANLVNEAIAYRNKSSEGNQEQEEGESSNNETSNWEYDNEEEDDEDDDIDEDGEDDESYDESSDEENNQTEQHFDDDAQNAQSDSSESTNPLQ